MTKGKKNVVGRQELAWELTRRRGTAKCEAYAIVSDLIDIIKEHVEQGERVCLAGFATFHLRHYGGRVYHNPATGERIDIKERTAPYATISKLWKTKINSPDGDNSEDDGEE